MKRAFKSIFSVITAISIHNIAFSQTCAPFENEDITNVYFGNGIMTSAASARASRDELAVDFDFQLESKYNNQDYRFFLAYNYSQEFITDTTQVLQQKLNELGIPENELSGYQLLQWLQEGLSYEEIRDVISSMVTITDPTGILENLTENALEGLYQSLSTAFVDATVDRERVIQEQYTQYSNALLSGKRVLIVAHSQGNLFANEVAKLVNKTHSTYSDSLQILGVATPAEFRVNTPTYVTAHDDFIINSLRPFESVLASNLDNDIGIFNDPRSFLRHLFIRDYYDPLDADRFGREILPSRQIIDDEIERLAEVVPFPPKPNQNELLEIELSWNAPVDLDLHIEEPDGTKVNFRRLSGASGQLLEDFQTGPNSEVYQAMCGNLKVGTYKVSYNYFDGGVRENGSLVAFPQAQTKVAGNVYNGNQYALRERRGLYGSETPVPTAEILVSLNNENIFEFIHNPITPAQDADLLPEGQETSFTK